MHNLAVFASGTGTNFVAIASACASGVLDARVAVMVCDKPGAAVIDRARQMGVETFVFDPHSYA
ncbi:MAG: phosphoribosylglycinamide formyltransferase, partial [Bacteroidales bacterium]|nr:phosphoribosylglycinamide formyltransferase [Bacteroidales bacterium]